jgi:putative membrane protein
MGIAEVIPGVSGGTIAFVTGIYRELLETIAGLSLRRLLLLRHGIGAFWRSTNIGFLVVLGAGMLTSILLFAQVVRDLLDTVPLLVWGFFFGLIVGSCVDVGRHSELRALLRFGPFGLAAGLLLGLTGAASLEPTPVTLFVGGTIAVTAWILPGVSGGYMLLLLGLYPSVIAAVADLQLGRLAAVALGCVLGLALFARLLTYLMRGHYAAVIAVLTGFMAGSLVKLWPWRIADAAGGELPVLPGAYRAATGVEPMLLGATLAMGVGLVAVVLLIRLRESRPAGSSETSW